LEAEQVLSLFHYFIHLYVVQRANMPMRVVHLAVKYLYSSIYLFL